MNHYDADSAAGDYYYPPTYLNCTIIAQLNWTGLTELASVVYRLGELAQRTFPAKILSPYWSTRSHKPRTPRPTPPSLKLGPAHAGPKRGEGRRARPVSQSRTVVRGQRRPTTAWPSHVLPTARQTPPAGRVAPIPRWNARPIKSSKTLAPHTAAPRANALRKD